MLEREFRRLAVGFLLALLVIPGGYAQDGVIKSWESVPRIESALIVAYEEAQQPRDFYLRTADKQELDVVKAWPPKFQYLKQYRLKPGKYFLHIPQDFGRVVQTIILTPAGGETVYVKFNPSPGEGVKSSILIQSWFGRVPESIAYDVGVLIAAGLTENLQPKPIIPVTGDIYFDTSAPWPIPPKPGK